MEIAEQAIAVVRCMAPECGERLTVPVNITLKLAPSTVEGYAIYTAQAEPDLTQVYTHVWNKHGGSISN